MEQREGAIPRLAFATFGQEGWSEARTIAEEEALLVNWADFPSLVPLGENRLASQYLRRGAGAAHAYEAHLTLSHDGGKSWQPAGAVHTDESATEHGFVSLLPLDDGRLGIFWLDGRELSEGGSRFQLRYREWTDSGFGAEELLDPDVCSCCQTDAVRSGKDTIVVYRDRDVDEVRDVSVLRRDEAGWEMPDVVSEDGWRIPACPVNGPAVDAIAERVAVAWFTAADDSPSVRVSFSDDAGISFGPPVILDHGRPIGRVDLALMPDGSAVVVWLEQTAERGAEVLLRWVTDSDGGGKEWRIGQTSADRPSGFPTIATIGGRVFLAWTTPGPPSMIRMAAVEISPGL
jgi:hypothetical protein